MIDSCLRLHGQLCPPEMLAFHETLEKFFRKNFHEEIQRLNADAQSDSPLTPRSRSHHPLPPPTSSYATSFVDTVSLRRTASVASTHRPSFVIPPLQLGQSALTSPPHSLYGGTTNMSNASLNGSMPKQTPLQKNLAHLARHGMNGVASGPGEGGASTSNGRGNESIDGGSPQGSFVNVVGSVGGNMSGGASIIGSVGGSIRGRFSRLNFGRRERETSN